MRMCVYARVYASVIWASFWVWSMAAGRSCRCQCWASILISSWKPIGLEGGTADNEWYPCGFAWPGPRHLSHAHTHGCSWSCTCTSASVSARLDSTVSIGHLRGTAEGARRTLIVCPRCNATKLFVLSVCACVCDTRSCCCCCCCVRAMPLTIRPMPNWQTRQSHCYFGGRLLFFRLAWAYCGPRPPAHAHAQRYTTPANCANKRGNERERESSRERERESECQRARPSSGCFMQNLCHKSLQFRCVFVLLLLPVVVVAAVTVAPFELFFQLGLLSTAIILLAVCCSNLINYQRNYKLC